MEKQYLDLIPSFVRVTTSSVFSQHNLIGTHAVYTLWCLQEVFGTAVGWRPLMEELTWPYLWLSISQACPGVWAAGALCGAQTGYLDGV